MTLWHPLTGMFFNELKTFNTLFTQKGDGHYRRNFIFYAQFFVFPNFLTHLVKVLCRMEHARSICVQGGLKNIFSKLSPLHRTDFTASQQQQKIHLKKISSENTKNLGVCVAKFWNDSQEYKLKKINIQFQHFFRQPLHGGRLRLQRATDTFRSPTRAPFHKHFHWKFFRFVLLLLSVPVSDVLRG